MMQKKIKSLIYAGLGLILCVLLCGGIGMTAQAVETKTYGDFTYEEGKDGITITMYTGNKKKVVIPDKINGTEVISIGYKAFFVCTSLTGVTIPEGVTKIEDIDLKNLKTNAFLYRNDGLVAQTDQATAKTNTIHLNYRKAIRNLFIKINEYPYENFKNFDVVVYGSDNGVVGEDIEIYHGKNKNLFQIPHNVLTNYIKIKITSDDEKIIKNVTLFAQYNVDLESPRVTDIDYGTCTSKIYDVGIQSRYIVKEVDYDLLDGSNVKIQVRGLKNSNGENVWTEWYDIEQNHEFDQYRYFQFKTIIKDRFTKVRINKFVFEVKG